MKMPAASSRDSFKGVAARRCSRALLRRLCRLVPRACAARLFVARADALAPRRIPLMKKTSEDRKPHPNAGAKLYFAGAFWVFAYIGFATCGKSNAILLRGCAPHGGALCGGFAALLVPPACHAIARSAAAEALAEADRIPLEMPSRLRVAVDFVADRPILRFPICACRIPRLYY